jgi:hypothetical protein
VLQLKEIVGLAARGGVTIRISLKN